MNKQTSDDRPPDWHHRDLKDELGFDEDEGFEYILAQQEKFQKEKKKRKIKRILNFLLKILCSK